MGVAVGVVVAEVSVLRAAVVAFVVVDVADGDSSTGGAVAPSVTSLQNRAAAGSTSSGCRLGHCARTRGVDHAACNAGGMNDWHLSSHVE